jgi:hypothetical protein
MSFICPILGKRYFFLLFFHNFSANYLSTPTGYTSVYNAYVLLNPTTKFLHDYLFDKIAYSRGGACSSNSDCTAGPYGDAACMQGACVYSATYYHAAVSLAFQSSEFEATEPTFVESKYVFFFTLLMF